MGSLGLGTAGIGNLGSAISENDALATVEEAIAGGVRWIDTAPHYGLGLAEKRLGRVIAGLAPKDVKVSTKVGRLLEPNPSPIGSDLPAGGFDVPDQLRRRGDVSRHGVRSSLHGSLERLGLDSVEVAYLHDPEDSLDRAFGEGLTTLQELRDEGLVRSVGVATNFVATVQAAVERGGVDRVMLAGRWTLLDRSAQTVLDLCADADISVTCAAPFNSGLLASPRVSSTATFDYRRAQADVVARAEQLAAICDASGCTLPQAALWFPLRHPAVDQVVVGARSSTEIRGTLDRFLDGPPGEETWAMLDRIVATRTPSNDLEEEKRQP